MVKAQRKGARLLRNKARVLIVDDHPVVRLGIRQRLALEPDLEVCGEVATAAEGLGAVEALHPDVALVDLALDDRNGLELIKDIVFRGIKTAILVVSSHDESVYAERCVRAGARGYLNKSQAMDSVVEAIRCVASGRLYLSEAISSRLQRRDRSGRAEPVDSPLDRLSDRELQVYEMLGRGHTVTQIAEKLFLSPKTIETYRAHLKEKLNLRNSNELTHHAIQWVLQRAR